MRGSISSFGSGDTGGRPVLQVNATNLINPGTLEIARGGVVTLAAGKRIGHLRGAQCRWTARMM